MLFLFENTLTHYIYSILYLDNPGDIAHKLGKFYAMSRHATPTATPSPRSEQPHAHEQPHPNDIKAHNINRFREADGRTLAPSGIPHALHRAPSVPSRTPSPAMVCVRIYLQVSPYLHHTNGLQGGGCFFSPEVCSKSQLALTVKNLTRFQGFDIRIAVIGKFGF